MLEDEKNDCWHLNSHQNDVEMQGLAQLEILTLVGDLALVHQAMHVSA